MTKRYVCSDADQLSEGLEEATSALQEEELVVLPTDTVYGIAADAFEPAAVRKLLRAKGRGRDMPPPVLVAAASTLDALATNIPGYARDMVAELWPGGLTLVCRQQSSLSWDLGDNRETVAVRVPDNEYAIALLKKTGPLAVSSANTHGDEAATDVDAAEAMLGDKVAVYLDGGPCAETLSSTIVDVTGPDPRVLREGAIGLERLKEFNEHVTVVS